MLKNGNQNIFINPQETLYIHRSKYENLGLIVKVEKPKTDIWKPQTVFSELIRVLEYQLWIMLDYWTWGSTPASTPNYLGPTTTPRDKIIPVVYKYTCSLQI